MENTNIYLLLQFLLYSFSTALSFYVIEKIYNLIFKKEIIHKGQENSILDNNAYKVKERATLMHLPNKFLDPNFVKEFRKYSTEYCRINPDDFDKFNKYITSEFDTVKSEYNKKKLQNGIRNAVIEIAKQDTNMFSNNTSAKTHIPNNVPEPELENLNKNKNIQHNI